MAYQPLSRISGSMSLGLIRAGLRRCVLVSQRCMCTADNGNNHDQRSEETQDPSPGSRMDEDDVEQRILNTALSFVPIHGWSKKAIIDAAKAEGFPSVTHGMFPRGGGDLVHHFVRNCNSELAKKMSNEMQEREESEDSAKISRTAIIRDAVETRLRMIIPYVDSWPQAMALTALPENITEHFKNLGILMDDIWFYAGDKSTDFSWYTKRASLAVVYKTTEMCLIQDNSLDFEETWSFLDRRLADAASVGHLRMTLEQFSGNFGVNATTAFETVRNMAGLNVRSR
ncbi:ubiquinone biosynthesis protein COQ9, mitochondrial-like [Ptychodera flava]|uniref:ubiquinone biosynthesis protein COQ9, mitochondrial-like n=1 Tax=Ptychodera flava TaxID=63121 RepID=UPI00396AA0DE